jgi:hypothetical protein
MGTGLLRDLDQIRHTTRDAAASEITITVDLERLSDRLVDRKLQTDRLLGDITGSLGPGPEATVPTDTDPVETGHDRLLSARTIQHVRVTPVCYLDIVLIQ